MVSKRFDTIKSMLDYTTKDVHYYILLLSAPILLTFYRYFSYPENIFKYFPSLLTSAEGTVMGYKWHFFGFFILMFLVPALHVFFFWRKSFDDLGWGLGDKKFGIKFTIITLIFMVLPVRSVCCVRISIGQSSLNGKKFSLGLPSGICGILLCGVGVLFQRLFTFWT
jgi:hypothetical protein